MWYLLYNVLLILVSPVILLVLLAKQRCRRGLPQRLGLTPERDGGTEQGAAPRVIWVHAVSLGEVVAVAPLVRDLRTTYPDARLVVSTVTETGREAVEQRLADIAAHRYAPLDFPWVVNRALDAVKPSLYLFVETELWPNMLRALHRRGIPSIMVNGRLSTRSYRRQRWPLIRDFYRTMLSLVTVCLVQSERDAQRMVELGADPARVRCTGNIKFDQPVPQASAKGAGLSKAGLGVADHERVFVAGSTHPGEEEAVLAAYERLIPKFPDLVLIMAPRHVERAAQVEQVVRARGLAVFRRSQGDGTMAGTGPRVMVLDTRGELALLYREAAVTLVGGTLVPIGGHNLLEPAVWGKPVLFGPYTDHCAEVAGLLTDAGGGQVVATSEALAERVGALLLDPERLHRMGQAARDVVVRNQGALRRSLEVIATYLPPHAASAERVEEPSWELSSRHTT